MSRQGWLCANCTHATATSFCTCGGQETFLCDNCFGIHRQKAPLQLHFVLPSLSYGQHKLPGFSERHRVRAEKFEAAKAEILKNIVEIDRCITELSDGIEAIVTEVRTYGNRQLAQLRNLREEFSSKIQGSIAEAESLLYHDTPAFTNAYTSDIQSYDGNPERLKFFEFGINLSVVLKNLPSVFTFTSEADPKYFTLPGIKNDTLRLFNTKTRETRSFPLSKRFSNEIRICYISHSELLIVGSDPASTAAWVFNISKPQLEEIQPMFTARRYPALLDANNAAYVFCGNCIECEKLEIENRLWTQLPQVPSKDTGGGYTPCLYLSDIYLMQAKATIDIFNLASQTFRQRTINANNLTKQSISFLLADEIVILTCKNQMGRWKVDTDVFEVSTFQRQGDSPDSQCLPVLAGREVYFVRWDTGNLNSFHLDSKLLVRK